MFQSIHKYCLKIYMGILVYSPHQSSYLMKVSVQLTYCCITMVCAYHAWPVAFQQTRVPNSLPMGVNYVDYQPQGTEVIQVCLQTTP